MIDCLSGVPNWSDNFRTRDQVGPTGTIPMLLGSRNAIERSRVPRANRDVSVIPQLGGEAFGLCCLEAVQGLPSSWRLLAEPFDL